MNIRGENVHKICTELISLKVWNYENKKTLIVEKIAKKEINIIESICRSIALLPLTLIIWTGNLIADYWCNYKYTESELVREVY